MFLKRLAEQKAAKSKETSTENPDAPEKDQQQGSSGMHDVVAWLTFLMCFIIPHIHSKYLQLQIFITESQKKFFFGL